ncbi:MAG: 2Fe-2S iron-sulfur cluster-binding protein [Steroidobacteraceae bacterium]|jgi:CDP-4-dehydro-6-deoxyglucose reductase|nr:2Fe-2S iron-sulfur cluster-binding protein [Steroidobacteraceae bacterium]
MQVTLRPQGRTFAIDAADTVLDAARRAGLVLPHSCKGGNCGSCRARLVSGRIDYPRGRPAGLADDEVAQGYVLLCRAHALEDLVLEAREIRRAGEVETKQLPCRVERLQRLAPEVMALYLRLPAVEDFEFRAGQYLDILPGDGKRRSFSIASPPHDASLIELHVRRGNEFTVSVFETMQPGHLLRIEGPLGRFVYREPEAGQAEGPAILVAGGTGFAPMKSILRHVLETGGRRRLHLYWGARNEADLYDDAWLRERVERFPQFRYTPVLSMPSDEEAARHRTGLVHEAVLTDWPDLANADVYACGPPALVDALRGALPSRGLPPDRFHCD